MSSRSFLVAIVIGCLLVPSGASRAQAPIDVWRGIRATGDSLYVASFHLATLSEAARDSLSRRVGTLSGRIRAQSDTASDSALSENLDRLRDVIDSAPRKGIHQQGKPGTPSLPVPDTSACSRVAPHSDQSILIDVNRLIRACAMHRDSVTNGVARALLSQIGGSLDRVTDAQMNAEHWDDAAHLIQSLYLEYRMFWLERQMNAMQETPTVVKPFMTGRLGLVVDGANSTRTALGSLVQWRAGGLPRMASSLLAWMPSTNADRQRRGVEANTGLFVGNRAYALPGVVWWNPRHAEYGGAVLAQYGRLAVGPSYYSQTRWGIRALVLGR